MFDFTVHATDGSARAGTFATPHGDVPTPAFMPVATLGSVKALDPADLSSLGGPAAVPLIDQEDGTYLLEDEFTVSGENNLRDIEVSSNRPPPWGPLPSTTATS